MRTRRSREWASGALRSSAAGPCACSYRDRCFDRGVMPVILNVEIVEDVFEQAGRPAPDREPGRLVRSPRELQVGLIQMIEVQMAIAARPDEFSELESALLRDHMSEQGIGCNIEWHAEQRVGAALVQLAGQSAAGHIELEQDVARQQGH